MKKLLVLLIIFVLSLFLALPVSAADFSVVCGDEGGCTKSSSDPLFPESELWYPGKIVTRSFSIENVNSETKSVSIQADRQTSDGDLEKVMLVKIVYGGVPVWGEGTLEKFYDAGRIDLGNFNHDEEKSYDFRVEMTNVGNNYQNKKSQFNFTLGFWEEPASPTTPTPTPASAVHGARTQMEWYDGQGGPLEDNLGGGIATTAGEVAGDKAPICPFWWRVLVGQTLLLTVFYFLSRKIKGLFGFKWPVAAGVVLLGFLVDYYAHTHWYLPSRLCPHEVWLGGALAIIQWQILPFPKTKKSRKLRLS